MSNEIKEGPVTWRELARVCPTKCKILDAAGKASPDQGFVLGDLTVYEDPTGYWFYHPGFRDGVLGIPSRSANNRPFDHRVLIRLI